MAKTEKTENRTRVAKVVNLSVSIGDEDSERLLPEFIDALKGLLSGEVKNVTVTGSHYLILKDGSGKICREPDYDPATRDFRPGATPPPWAGGAPEAKRVERQQNTAPGARDPEHLRTVQETLAARGKSGTGKKLRVKVGSHTGDSGAVTGASRKTPPVEVDVKAAEGSAERTAENSANALLSKLRASKKVTK